MSESVTPWLVVVGSINLDIVADLDHLPRAGETLLTDRVRQNLGGKGANQAVAAAIVSGSGVAFVGRLGDDAQAAELRSELASHGVDVDLLVTVPGALSGAAYIQVARGENTIVVASGANSLWSRLEDAERDAVGSASVVLCQMEIPDGVIADAARCTTGRFVLNAAPARAVDLAILALCDPLIVNENELADLSGMDISGPKSALAAAEEMRRRGALSVVTTLGADGSVWTSADGSGHRPTAPVEVVDSTGAGDLFVGAVCTRLARGDTLAKAVSLATTVASLSVGRAGTIDSYPDADSIAALPITED